MHFRSRFIADSLAQTGSPLQKLPLEWNHGESRALQNVLHCAASHARNLFLQAELVLGSFFSWHPMHKHCPDIMSNKLHISSAPSNWHAIIGSAEALPILCVRYFRWEREIQTEGERETERDGSDITIVALKLAMNLHFPLPKIRTIGDELTLSLAKNSHFSFLPSHFPSLPSRRGHHCGAEIGNEFTLSIAKKIFALFVPPLSNGTSRATSDRKPKTNDQILPSPILFFPSKNWIKLIPKTIGNRKKRLCVRWLGVINLTWENLQIAKHKSGRRSFSLADWFVLCDL